MRIPRSLSLFTILALIPVLSCKTAAPDSAQTKAGEPAPQAEAGALEGIVVSLTPTTAVFATVTDDYILKLSERALVDVERIRASQLERKKLKLALMPQELSTKQPNALGIRPDCSEQPLAYDELVGLARQAPDLTGFLKSLPPATMQTFTLVHKSQSPLKDEVDAKWPRVLRMSADAKLIFAYACRPQGAHENSMEIMRFDDATKEFKFSEVRFGEPEASRVHENPRECQQCHAPTMRDVDPRPNWQMYFTWDGVYGIHDDQIGAPEPAFLKKGTNPLYYFSAPLKNIPPPPAGALTNEVEAFKDFRKLQKDNPCYATLPWAPTATLGYELFPYSTTFKSANYHLRPNLKFSEGLAHLMGQRMARKFSERPAFQPLRFIAAKEAFSCTMTADDLATLKAVLPNYQTPTAVAKTGNDVYQNAIVPHDPRLAQAGGPILFAIGKALGFAHADWSMSFNRPADPVYNTGLSADSNVPLVADVSIVKVTQAALMDRLGAEFPEMKTMYGKTRGESANFGAKFQCVDDNGGQLYPKGGKAKICAMLAEKQAASKAADLEAAKKPYTPRKPAGGALTGGRDIVQDRGTLDQELVKAGEKVAETTCATCHAGESGGLPKKFHFFANEATLAVKLKSAAGEGPFLNVAFQRIDSATKPMPPADDAVLSEYDRSALAAYLNDVFLR